MISNIIGGVGISVNPGSSPYVSTSGIVRWNGQYQRLEVIHGESTLPLNSGSSWEISTDSRLNDIMNWASIKMAEEQQLKVLMDKHPGLRDVKEKFDVMLALVKNNEFTEDK